MDDTRQLRAARDNLRTAARDLIQPTHQKVTRDDGTVTTHLTPSLIDQLRRAVRNNIGHQGGPRRSSPIPLSADAFDLLAEIRDRVGEPIETEIRAWAGLLTRGTDLDRITAATTTLTRWATGIRTLLDPPRKLHVAAPCPACDTRMVWRRDDRLGETVQQPALAIDDAVEWCTCQACGAAWPSTQFEHLARVLGVSQLDATLRDQAS